MEGKIIAAIAAKKVLSFTYRGLSRIVEPHVYGIQDGVAQLLGYQIRGGSSTERARMEAIPTTRDAKLADA